MSTPQVVPVVVLFDYLLNDAGAALSGERVIVTLNAPSPITTISPLTVLTTTQQQTTTDGNGYWSVSLVPNTNISPANTVYTVQTPAGTYDVTLGSVGPYQSTAAGTIVNVPTPLAPATAGAVTVGSINVSAGEPGIDTTAAGALLLGDNTATSIEMGAPTTVTGQYLAASIQDVGGTYGAVYNVLNPTYGAVASISVDQTAKMQIAVTAIKNAGRGILLIPPGAYLIGTANTPLDFTGCNNMMIYAVGAQLQLPAAGAGTMYGFQFNGTCSNIFMYGGELYSPYASASWSLMIQGSGSITDMKIVRWYFHGDNFAVSAPYMANMTPTANGGNNDLLFDYCRFSSPGTASSIINGLLVRGFLGLKVQNCTFVNINNPIAPDSTTQKDGFIYAGNYEYINTLAYQVEGPNPWGINHVTYVNNTQVIGSGISPLSTSDLGGVDFQGGVSGGCHDVVIVGNNFQGNGIVMAPATGAGNDISNVVIKDNTINCTRSTANFNRCINLLADPASASGHYVISGNACHGAFTGAPIFIGTGYTDVSIGSNPGANPNSVQAPAFAASFTPVLSLGTIIAPGVLTAAMTVNAFVYPLPGVLVTFIFTQDGTGGRLLTWNAAYKTAWQPALAASAISSISFMYDGTNWQQVAGQIGVDQSGNASTLNLTAIGATGASAPAAVILPGSILVSDTGAGVNAGGAVLFGASGGAVPSFFAAIKGGNQNGSNNTQGDLIFYYRKVQTDASLTEWARMAAGTNGFTIETDLIIGIPSGAGTRILTIQDNIPTVGSGGAGVSALSVLAGSTNTCGQVQATLTAIAPGVVIGVVAFDDGPLASAPKQVLVSLAAPTAGVAAPPITGADTYSTSGFTIRGIGPTTVTTGTYVITYWCVF